MWGKVHPGVRFAPHDEILEMSWALFKSKVFTDVTLHVFMLTISP